MEGSFFSQDLQHMEKQNLVAWSLEEVFSYGNRFFFENGLLTDANYITQLLDLMEDMLCIYFQLRIFKMWRTLWNG